jgi:DNA repair exonuclease SbcCD ATPase subunit
MRLEKLVVAHFGIVQSAHVEFGSGLNVLYGPNMLGKSTLAQAIRAALLVPFGSTVHEQWIAWGTDDPPEVDLIFSTGPQRFWRVRKTFGHSAVLEESKDGASFTNTTTGRRVDAELRKLLKWGIREPGGSGGPKGMPDTFLTAVLLAPQTNPTLVFEQSLTDDADESGRQSLTAALEALATDPLFARVLAETQAKYDEAFTAKGAKKTGRGSPFKQISDQIKQDEAIERDLRVQVQSSESVREELTRLRDERLRRSEEFERARAALTERRKLWQERSAIESRLTDARGQLNHMTALCRSVAETEAQEQELQKSLNELIRQSADAAQAVQRAVLRSAAAKEQLQRASSAEHLAARQLHQAELQKRLSDLEISTRDAQQLAEQARAALARAEQVTQLEAELSELQRRIERTRATQSVETAAEQQARSELHQLNGLEHWLNWRDASQELERARSSSSQADSLGKQAADKLAEADRIQAELATRSLPTPDCLVELRKLAEDVRVAEARIEVGLSARISPLKTFELKVSLDGARSKKLKLAREEVALDAQSRMKLTVGEWAEIEVIGGSADARQQVAALTERWQKATRPVFAAAAVATLDELETTCRAAAVREQQFRDLRREAAALQSQAESLAAPVSRIPELERRVADFEHALAGHDRAAIERRAGNQSQDRQSLARRRQQAADAADQCKKRVDALALELMRVETQASNLSTTLESARTTRNQAAPPADGWHAALTQAESTLRSIQSQRVGLQHELAALANQQDTAISQARDALREAEAACEQTKSQLRTIEEQKSTTTEALARCRGELAARREAAAKANVAAAAAAVQQLERALANLPTANLPITERSLQDDARHVEQLEAALRDVERRVDHEEGKLTQVGGDVIRERLESLTEALNRKREQEAELDLDYGAWKLLLETLRAVENTEAAHLGNAIVPAIARRFDELTGKQFGHLALDPNLETSGIIAAGEVRPLDVLSVGTREQLSAIFRAILAEQLGSALVLDDQLTQSDSQRMRWFRDFLRCCAEKTQIVVLTCRPSDYLDAGELPAANQPHRDVSSRLRVTDLELAVRSSRARAVV